MSFTQMDIEFDRYLIKEALGSVKVSSLRFSKGGPKSPTGWTIRFSPCVSSADSEAATARIRAAKPTFKVTIL